jgi:hypothetical protein
MFSTCPYPDEDSDLYSQISVGRLFHGRPPSLFETLFAICTDPRYVETDPGFDTMTPTSHAAFQRVKKNLRSPPSPRWRSISEKQL